MKKLPAGFKPSMVIPRAYCVAKPAHECAVFATYPADYRPPAGAESEVVHKWNSKDAPSLLWFSVGDWATLVYATKKNEAGWWFALPPVNATK